MHFEISQAMVDHKERYAHLPLTKKQKLFIQALLSAQEAKSGPFLTAQDVDPFLIAHGLVIADSTFRKYCVELGKEGIFDCTKRTRVSDVDGKPKKHNLWRLRYIEDLEKKYEGQILTKAESSVNPMKKSRKIQESNTQYIKTLAKSTPRMENLFFTFLSRCMPASAWDKVEGNFMRTALYFKKEKVVVETSTLTNGDRLMHWDDKPVMRTLLSQCISRLEKAICEDGIGLESLENNFQIDLVDIAHEMGERQPHNSDVHGRIYRAIRAMESTRFDVIVDDAKNSEFMEFFHLGNLDMWVKEAHFRFIDNVAVLDDMTERKEPRHLVISLGKFLWERIVRNKMTKAIYRSHSVMQRHDVERSLQEVYDYLRAVIFPTNQKGKPTTRSLAYPLQRFFKIVAPECDYWSFKENFIKGLKKQDKTGQVAYWEKNMDSGLMVEVLFAGYHYKLYKIIDPEPHQESCDNIWIEVERDVKDSIVGDPGIKAPLPPSGFLNSEWH